MKKKYKNPISIYIINYNTKKLTNALIKSIYKHIISLNYKIYIIDNSNVERFKLDNDIKNVVVLDNTNRKLFNTAECIKKYSKVQSQNNHASLKHAIAIQWILDNTKANEIILMDSDIILKKDIDFIDNKYITIADIESNAYLNRFCPFIQYFNVKMIKEKKIRYLDPNRMHGGLNDINSRKYDTGASFYEDVLKKKLMYKKINHSIYINHLRGGSWKDIDQDSFLNKNKIYFK